LKLEERRCCANQQRHSKAVIEPPRDAPTIAEVLVAIPKSDNTVVPQSNVPQTVNINGGRVDLVVQLSKWSVKGNFPGLLSGFFHAEDKPAVDEVRDFRDDFRFEKFLNKLLGVFLSP
jgi:hypothetical protein